MWLVGWTGNGNQIGGGLRSGVGDLSLKKTLMLFVSPRPMHGSEVLPNSRFRHPLPHVAADKKKLLARNTSRIKLLFAKSATYAI
jgi:hypothetical protein